MPLLWGLGGSFAGFLGLRPKRNGRNPTKSHTERSQNMKKSTNNKKSKPTRVIIQKSEETVEFSDFVDEVINFRGEEETGVNKRPSENEANFKGNSRK